VLCHNVLDFGNVTVGLTPTSEQEFANTAAFVAAFQAANASTTDRTVVVSEDTIISMHNMDISGIHDIEIIIDGQVLLSPHYKDFVKGQDWWVIRNCNNIKFTGKGVMDGQGYMWWIREWLQTNTNGRPNMINWQTCANIEMDGVLWKNSP
jgi:hypothetical protein